MRDIIEYISLGRSIWLQRKINIFLDQIGAWVFFAMEASNANIGLVSSFNFVDLDLTHCLYNQV